MMRILKEDTAGLIIDIQERLFPFIHENDTLTKNTTRLIEGLKVLDIPLVVTQQYTRGLGETIVPVSEALGEFEYLEKVAFSCCDDQGFSRKLEELRRTNIIITGIEAHVCVFQTTIDLLEKGFLPVVVEDCISSRNFNDRAVAIERMRREGAVITTYESILFELLRFSGTDQFKAISRIVK
jgi:nicotinamidase-related amidase